MPKTSKPVTITTEQGPWNNTSCDQQTKKRTKFGSTQAFITMLAITVEASRGLPQQFMQKLAKPVASFNTIQNSADPRVTTTNIHTVADTALREESTCYIMVYSEVCSIFPSYACLGEE